MAGLMVVFASGLALAVTKIGGPGKHGLVGTDDPSWLDGAGGDDSITGFDERGDPEGGILIGGVGNDFFFPRNENPAVRDVIQCGGGHDTVYADREDTLKRYCEEIFLRNPFPDEVCVRCDNAGGAATSGCGARGRGTRVGGVGARAKDTTFVHDIPCLTRKSPEKCLKQVWFLHLRYFMIQVS